MDQFFNAIKGQINTLNFLVLLCILVFFFHRKKKTLLVRISAIATIIFFLLTSTAYFPAYLTGRIESKYTSFNITAYPGSGETTFIHVLGGGYTLDTRLPAQAQLSLVSLGRLMEGLRISRLVDSSTLIVSGNIASGNSSMAEVAKKTAIELGFDPSKIEVLETPGTTREEAKAFADLHGTDAKVIVVTDAVHMPRAIRFFNEYGIEAYPAPTNFLVKYDDNPFSFRWMPSIENFLLMDRIIREFFGSVKGSAL